MNYIFGFISLDSMTLYAIYTCGSDDKPYVMWLSGTKTVIRGKLCRLKYFNPQSQGFDFCGCYKWRGYNSCVTLKKLFYGSKKTFFIMLNVISFTEFLNVM